MFVVQILQGTGTARVYIGSAARASISIAAPHVPAQHSDVYLSPGGALAAA